MSNTEKSPRIAFSSANVADPRFKPLRMFSPWKLGKLLRNMTDEHGQPAYAGGVEYHPILDWLAAQPGQIEAAVKSEALVLNSVHACFRATRRSRHTDVFPKQQPHPRSLESKVLASPVGRLLMPEVVDSSKWIAAVRRKVGPVPAVLYPQKNPALQIQALEGVDKRDGDRLVQVSDEMAAIVGARNVEELVEKTIGAGICEAFVLDTHHAQRQWGQGGPGVISNLEVSLPQLQPYVRAGNFSVGRVDSLEGEPVALQTSTAADLRYAFEGHYEGAIGEMLHLMRGVDYVTVETVASQVSAALGSDNPRAITEGYAAIGGHLAEYFAAA